MSSKDRRDVWARMVAEAAKRVRASETSDVDPNAPAPPGTPGGNLGTGGLDPTAGRMTFDPASEAAKVPRARR